MRKSFVVSAACAALGLATIADAAIIASLRVSNPNPTGMPGYAGVIIRLTSDQGNITAVDFGGIDATKPQEALKGFFALSGGGIHQRWSVGEDPVTGDPVNNPTPRGAVVDPTAAASRDSFWNTNNISETAIVYPAQENNSLTGSPIANTATTVNGLGTEMHYTTGIGLAAQTAALDIAYLVIPLNTQIRVRGEVAVGTKVAVDQVVAIPEPATAGLLSLGGLSLLARRRRD